MIINRAWAMPNRDTCSIKPIAELVDKYLSVSNVSADVFARNAKLCTYTNDMDVKCNTTHHLMAEDFLKLPEIENVDLFLFDPPNTLRQVKECYEGNGRQFFQQDSTNSIRWTIERDLISKAQKVGGVVISFGYTTTCMGKKRGYEIEEILIVSHGAAHSDTLITVERLINKQPELFQETV